MNLSSDDHMRLAEALARDDIDEAIVLIRSSLKHPRTTAQTMLFLAGIVGGMIRRSCPLPPGQTLYDFSTPIFQRHENLAEGSPEHAAMQIVVCAANEDDEMVTALISAAVQNGLQWAADVVTVLAQDAYWHMHVVPVLAAERSAK